MTRAIPVLGLLCSLAFISCDKKEYCNNARVCVYNATGDTVRYAFNSNFQDKILLPNDTACNYVGEVSRSQSYTTTFYSDHGNYFLDVEQCREEFTLD